MHTCADGEALKRQSAGFGRPSDRLRDNDGLE
jgi:hypothetical protein